MTIRTAPTGRRMIYTPAGKRIATQTEMPAAGSAAVSEAPPPKGPQPPTQANSAPNDPQPTIDASTIFAKFNGGRSTVFAE